MHTASQHTCNFGTHARKKEIQGPPLNNMIPETSLINQQAVKRKGGVKGKGGGERSRKW